MQCEIAVIGNGVIGKSAALAFAQSGFEVVLVTQTAALRAVSADWDARVYALNHQAKSLLTTLKVWDALESARIAPVEAMRIGDDDNGQLDFDAYSVNQLELAWIVEDQNLNQALDAALRFAPNIRSVSATTVAVNADFSEITLSDQSTLKADLWIGADGAQSWLRNQADIGIDYRAYGQRGVVANFSCAKPHHGVAFQWFTNEQGIVALLPLPGQQVSLVWSAPDSLAQSLMRETPEQLAERLAVYCGEQLGVLTPLPPQRIQSFPLQFIAPHSVIAPRLALVGDAAHVVHPLAGHGMNLGFADVAALLEAVTERESWRACGDERVLQRYARSRREEVALMQLTTDGLTRLFGSAFAPVQTLRHIGLQLINRSSFLKKQLIQKALGGSSLYKAS